MSAQTLRIVQWDTGNIGTRALRAVIEHPDLELVGVYVHAESKAGRDAGALCGLDSTGVIATRDVDDIIALGADCVLYMPRQGDLDEVCRLLAAGSNIVTTCGEFHPAALLEPTARTRVEAACELGGTSIHSTGSSPGFITEAVPLVLLSIQRRLDHLTIDEFADLSRRDSPELLFGIMGFGGPRAEFEAQREAQMRAAFGPSLHLIAEAISRPLDSVVASAEVATARHSVQIAAGPLAAGTVAAQRITVQGIRDGRPLLIFRATWYCTTDLEPAWDVRATGWHLAVEGDAPLDVDLRFPIPLERMAEMSPAYTANRAVNAILSVCAAAPGLRSTLDLPHVISALR